MLIHMAVVTPVCHKCKCRIANIVSPRAGGRHLYASTQKTGGAPLLTLFEKWPAKTVGSASSALTRLGGEQTDETGGRD